MADAAQGADERLNLEKLGVLLIEPNTAEQDLVSQILTGFGVRNLHRCSDAGQAPAALASFSVGLIVMDGASADGAAYAFVQWLRRQAAAPQRHLPVLMMSGHVRMVQVVRARDCGANFMVSKPVSPRVLLDRIAWLARESRGFVAVEGGYVGPDRRFRTDGPPPGQPGRRRGDEA